MRICFWTPYIGNVGTIKATIHSAESIKKYSDEKVEINLFKIHSEWEGYESSILNAKLNIIDFNLKKYFKNLPKYGIFSRFTMLLMMFYSIPKLIKYFNNEKPEVVFGYLQGITPLIARYFSKHKPKIIVSIQGLPSFLASKEVYEKYPIWKKIEANMRIYLWKKIYKNADNIITLTEETKINILDIFNFDKQKILYIPNPIIDDEIYDKVDEIIDDSFVIENDYILAIGRYTLQKDFQTLIKAFKIVKESHQKLNLIILGEGELRDQLQVLINQQKLKDKVKLYGFVSNPYKFLKKAKLFVLSSLWEDQGHTLVEATYLRVPVVSTKCPSGQVELLSHGEAGYLCEIGNEIDMAKKIIEALENIDSKKIELAYNNSLKFTSNQFYKSLKKTYRGQYMKIDVVIATYNRAKQIEETINNVLQFEQDINKIFIINNNSKDNTREVLEKFNGNSKIDITNSDENLGAPGGKNIGLKKSQADLIIVIDDDAIFFTEDPINEVKRIFKNDNSLGIIQFKIVNFQEKRIQRYEFPGDNPEKYGDKEFYTGYFIGAGHAIRKKTLEEVGYYPDEFFYAHEEIDLSYKAINGDYTIKYCPMVGVYHKKDPGGRLPPKEVIKSMYKNRLVMSYKYLPFKYSLISNFLWFLKTLKDSKSIVIPLKAISEFLKSKNLLVKNTLSKNAIEYIKKYNGRLYR